MENILISLTKINAYSVYFTILFTFLFFLIRHSLFLASVSVMMLVTSPLLYYSCSSFNEGTAAFVTLLFTLSCLWRGQKSEMQGLDRQSTSRAHPVFIVFFFVLAGVTKEVAPPFLFLIGILSFWPGIVKTPKQYKKEWISLTAGMSFSVFFNSLFNLWRFGSILNLANLDPSLRVPNFQQHLVSFTGILFSPNGGIFFFCFLFSLLIVYLFWNWIRRFISLSPTTRVFTFDFFMDFGFQIGFCAVFFGLISGFSKWYAPFGWVAWGPRLMVPWIPSLMVLVMDRFANDVETGLRKWILRPRALLCILLVAGVLSLPQYLIAFTDGAFSRMFAPTLECPPTITIQSDPASYYRCINHLIWPQHFYVLLEVWKETLTSKWKGHLVPILGYLGCLLALLKIAVHSLGLASGLEGTRRKKLNL